MISRYVRDRGERLKVSQDFVGKQWHFSVENEKGEKHLVSVQVGCDCNFMSNEGIPNPSKGVCSHVVAAVLDMIKVKEGK